jgi:Na+/phosphate symporter
LVIENIAYGFFAIDQTPLKEAEARLSRILTTNLPFTEELLKKKAKDEVETKYLNLLPDLQLMAVIIRNLINENKRKIESNLLFTDKAVTEIKALFALMQTQFQDTTDYILTRNPHLSMHIRTGMESLFKMADDSAAAHQTRLITGVCVPKTSYLYVAIIDFIKGVSRELTTFSDKL